MNCSCNMECCGDDPVSVLMETKLKARINHSCSECGSIIKKGNFYNYLKCDSEDETMVFKTCNDCQSLINQFFSSGYNLAGLWESFEENVDGFGCEIPESCISELTQKAREKVCKIIEDCWGSNG